MMKKYLFSLFVSLVLLHAVNLMYAVRAQNSQPEQLIKIETTLGNMVIKLYNETPASP